MVHVLPYYILICNNVYTKCAVYKTNKIIYNLERSFQVWTLPSCAPYRVSISTSISIVDGLSCKNLTESSVYMARKHVHVIEKTFTVFTKRVLIPFYDEMPCPWNFTFFLQLVEVIWNTAANPGETFTPSCAEKYEGFFALYRMKLDFV